MRHVLAGTLARTLAQAFVHPVDTVKTRLQVCVSIWNWTVMDWLHECVFKVVALHLQGCDLVGMFLYMACAHFLFVFEDALLEFVRNWRSQSYQYYS